MITDVFAVRYRDKIIRNDYTAEDSLLLSQIFTVVIEDLFSPFDFTNGEEAGEAESWSWILKVLTREFGTLEFSGLIGAAYEVCRNWMLASAKSSADEHIKARISLVELAFQRMSSVIGNGPQLSRFERTIISTNSFSEEALHRASSDRYDKRIVRYSEAVREVNERFRRARYPLHYHNGLIQLVTDEATQFHVEAPFWSALSGPMWANVDRDMKRALAVRDTGGYDPAFHAAKALESTLKIICKILKCETGKEKSAYNYIDNLQSKRCRFISNWEGDTLKAFFKDVRNHFGHGPGSEEPLELTKQQEIWAIEYCMISIKSLVSRL